MESRRFNYAAHVLPLGSTGYIAEENGYIVWRYGTGGNVELCHLRTYKQRKGHGRTLLRYMLEALRDRPPYHTVYGFTLSDNTSALGFYGAMGFTLTGVVGVYQLGTAHVFSAPYVDLYKRHCEGRV